MPAYARTMSMNSRARYRTAMADLEKRIDNAAAGERVKLNKERNKLQAQAEEIHVYEEKIHHLADQMIASIWMMV